jgi:hypothetical protein
MRERLLAAMSNEVGSPPDPTAIGRALMAVGIYPSSQLPYAPQKPAWMQELARGVGLATMGARPSAAAGGPMVVPRGMDPRPNPDHIGATPGAATLSRWGGVGTVGRSSWPRRGLGPLEPANANDAPYPMRTMDPMVTRFLRALDGETPLHVQLPKLTVIEGGLPPRKN